MHASPELIQKTKEAMRKEEERIRNKRKIWMRMPIVAAVLQKLKERLGKEKSSCIEETG